MHGGIFGRRSLRTVARGLAGGSYRGAGPGLKDEAQRGHKYRGEGSYYGFRFSSVV